MPASDAQRSVEELTALLREQQNPTRAVSEKAYLKSQLDFLGVSVPLIRATTRAWAKTHPLTHDALIDLVRTLWATSLHDLHATAIELLIRHKPLLVASDMALLEELIGHSYTWAYVDTLSTDVTADLVTRYPELNATLERWSTDGDFWIRRASMLALLPPMRGGGGDFERFGRYADSMLEEREFFIRKAIGWILRDTSKRRPELVAEWLLPRAHRASSVTVREAVKYLDAADREAIMAAYSGASKAGRRNRSVSRETN